MIDLAEALQAVPPFKTFWSVESLMRFVESLSRSSKGFRIRIAGTSGNGIPIHHVRFGKGSVKALFVGFPHPNEPIGGLTVFSLLTLLNQKNRGLIDADVEWHIVPCIDPDGAMLNEGWSQQPFTLRNYMKNFHRQELCQQVECTFPINHKKLKFDKPTKEAMILQGLLTDIRPNFYYSLHNTWAGGAFYCLTRDIHEKYYQELYRLLEQHQIPLQTSTPFKSWCTQFGAGISEHFTTRKYYDFLEKTTPFPEELLQCGACSWEYLAEIDGSAMTFKAELPYLKHPADGSMIETTQNLRQLKLKLDADNKFIVTMILEEWDKVKEDLDTTSPFYKKVLSGVVAPRETLHEGLPSWPDKTRDILFNPGYSKTMTEGERFNEYMRRFYVLCNGYEFVRLLKRSIQTPAVRHAAERLRTAFDEALDDIGKHISFDQFEAIDCSTLAKVQLGSGLIMLNSIVETHDRDRGRSGSIPYTDRVGKGAKTG